METARKVTDDISILPSYFPIPGFGLVPVNSYVIKAQQPVLIDTGLHSDSDAFMAELGSVIDPLDLKWLYLTHPDQDHVGSLRRLMNDVPGLRLITTFLGYGIISLFDQIPLDRVYFLNQGESLDVGDRTLTAMRPPAFDNPATTAVFESKTRSLFSSDFFGGLVQAPAEVAEDIATEDRRQGQVLWSTIDAPWLHSVDRTRFAAALNAVKQTAPDRILSSHLPPASGAAMDDFIATVASAPDAPAFLGPNQAALEAMLAQMTQGVPA